jgi:hypothetical protein
VLQRGGGTGITTDGPVSQDWLLGPATQLARHGQRAASCAPSAISAWVDARYLSAGAKAEHVFAHTETFHKTRLRPKGEVQTFAKIDPATMVPYKVDTEDFGSLLLKFGRAKHGFASGVHANASISQVAAGMKCSMSFGIFGTEGSARWTLDQGNEILIGRRDEPNQILQRSTPGFDVDIAGFTDYPGGHAEGSPMRTRCSIAPSTSTSRQAARHRRSSPLPRTGITRCSCARRSSRARSRRDGSVWVEGRNQ